MVVMYSLQNSLLFLIIFLPMVVRGGGGVFTVKRKFGGKDNPSIDELLKHDAHRHARLLLFANKTAPMAIDVPLGGHFYFGKYYTEVAIGTPPKNFTLHVDTGSDVLWVNCVPCQGCLNRERMTIYDPNRSKTARTIKCGESLCKTLLDDQRIGDTFPCKNVDEKFRSNPHDAPCYFIKKYGDETEVEGTYVTDLVSFNQVSGDHKTQPASASITFGCASKKKEKPSGQESDLKKGIDGLIGFAPTASSMLSQLASSGKASKVFSHCLDSSKYGGVFAIGRVLNPKVKTTPLIPNMPFGFHVSLKAIQVGNEFVQLPTTDFLDAKGDPNRGTILDTGSTLAVVPRAIYKPLLKMIFSNHPNLITGHPANFTEFEYPPSMDGFPIITLHFEEAVTMVLKPEQYIVKLEDTAILAFTVMPGFGDMVAFGDIFLMDKLVIYDLEKQTVGWTDYNCSLGIQIEDEMSGNSYKVDEHEIEASKEFCPSPSPSS